MSADINMTKDFSAFLAKLDADIDDVLRDGVADGIRDRIPEVVEREVYARYEPTMYERRREAGGLADADNYEIYVGSSPWRDRKLILTNRTKGSDGGAPRGRDYYFGADNPSDDWKSDIADVVESGRGYPWKNSRIALAQTPRPFMEELLDVRKSEELLMRGLRKKRYNDIFDERK